MKKIRKKAKTISRYSGCCDWCDVLEIHNYTLEELQNNVKIYIGFDSPEPLHIEKMSDLIPYYPYVICTAIHNNADRTATIHLTSESHVDVEEQERLNLYLEQLLKIYNRCKRKKIEFDVKKAVDEVSFWNFNLEAIMELANRVKLHGKKATIDGIHLKMHEFYRKQLVEEMLKNGLNPAKYGYERFVSKEV